MKPGKKDEETIIKNKHGFSFLEVLIAMAIALVVLAAAFGVFKSMTDSSAAANQVYEITADAQASLNMIRRDLQRAVDIPGIGIPVLTGATVSWGGGYCTVEAATSFKCETDSSIIPPVGRDDGGSGLILDAVTPNTVNGKRAITILYFDEFARDIAAGISTNNVLAPATSADTRFAAIRADDFVFLHDGPGPVLQQVTEKNGNTAVMGVTGTYGINQPLPTGSVQVSLLRRVTYYLKDEGGSTWLVRQVNNRPAERLVPGVTDIELSYNIVDALGVLDLDTAVGTVFFDSNRDQTQNIRRVNVDIKLDSETSVNPGIQKTVQSAQVAKIAVRRASRRACPCHQEWSDVLGECVSRGCPDGFIGANLYWDVTSDSCQSCAYYEESTGCGCNLKCDDPNTYFDPSNPYADENGCVQRAPVYGCNFATSGQCNQVNCQIQTGSANCPACRLYFVDSNGVEYQYNNPSIFSNNTLMFQGVPSSFYTNYRHPDGLVYIYYTDHQGKKSETFPLGWNPSGGNSCRNQDAMKCDKFSGDSCLDACQDHWMTNGICYEGCYKQQLPWAIEACKK